MDEGPVVPVHAENSWRLTAVCREFLRRSSDVSVGFFGGELRQLLNAEDAHAVLLGANVAEARYQIVQGSISQQI